MAVLVGSLGELEVGGNVQVRGRGFGKEVVGGIREVGLGERMMRKGGGRVCGREVPGMSCGVGAGEEMDWEWEGGVVM